MISKTNDVSNHNHHNRIGSCHKNQTTSQHLFLQAQSPESQSRQKSSPTELKLTSIYITNRQKTFMYHTKIQHHTHWKKRRALIQKKDKPVEDDDDDDQ